MRRFLTKGRTFAGLVWGSAHTPRTARNQSENRSIGGDFDERMTFGPIALVVLALVSTPCMAQPPRITAAIMVAGDQAVSCQIGTTGNDIYMVEVSTKRLHRFVVGSFANCAVLPLTVPVGTIVSVNGAIQFASSISGGITPPSLRTPEAPSVESPTVPPLNNACFDVEAYSTGLSAIPGSSEFDPNVANNMIAGTQYGLAWWDSLASSKPGPWYYTVAGCGRKSCSTKIDDFNSVTPDLPPNTPCAVLAPMSPQ
jgi:hypothetical protein